MKFKNLHEDNITIITKAGALTARPGEIIEIDEETYAMVKDFYPKLELQKEVSKPVEPVQEKPKAKGVKNARNK